MDSRSVVYFDYRKGEYQRKQAELQFPAYNPQYVEEILRSGYAVYNRARQVRVEYAAVPPITTGSFVGTAGDMTNVMIGANAMLNTTTGSGTFTPMGPVQYPPVLSNNDCPEGQICIDGTCAEV